MVHYWQKIIAGEVSRARRRNFGQRAFGKRKKKAKPKEGPFCRGKKEMEKPNSIVLEFQITNKRSMMRVVYFCKAA